MLTIKSVRPIRGYIFGSHYPSLLVSLKINACNDEKFIKVANRLLFLLSSSKSFLVKNHSDLTYRAFCQTIEEIIAISEWPIFQPIILIEHKENDEYRFLIPCMEDGFRSLSNIILQLMELFNAHCKSQQDLSDKHFNLLIEKIKKLRMIASRDSNSINFIKAALELKIPFSQLSNNFYQFGYCKNSRWLNSTFTDQTSQIASAIARNKFISNKILRACGIPTTKNIGVNNLQSAIEAAKILKYPVVLKPMKLDGGNGVFANIESEEELISNFKKSLKFGNDILVEKHFFGKDYRLVVFKNQVIFAIERVPANVVGDGILNIEQLIEIENELRKDKPSLAKLNLDNDSIEMLKKNDYSKDTIPKLGEVVYLRSISNINVGGTPKPVLDLVHPDNKTLVINATKSIGLDIAGVDLIIPNVSESWIKIGNHGVICEINAQPTLGSLTSSHLYPYLLDQLVSKRGRIPIIALINHSDNRQLANQIKNNLRTNKISAAYISEHEESNDLFKKASVSQKTRSIFEKGLIASHNKEVETVILELTDNDLFNDGLAFSYIDTLVVAKEISSNLLKAMLPMVTKEVIVLDGYLDQKTELQLKNYCQIKTIEFKKTSTSKAIKQVLRNLNNDFSTS